MSELYHRGLDSCSTLQPYQFSQQASWWSRDNHATRWNRRKVSIHPFVSCYLLTLGNHSTLFNAIHSPNVLKMLTPEQCVGSIDVSTLPSRKADAEEQQRIALASEQLPLVSIINLHDFEVGVSSEIWVLLGYDGAQEAASKLLTKTAWAYYSSFAEEGASEWLVSNLCAADLRRLL